MDLLKCTVNNQSLTQVTYIYVHVSFCLKVIRSWQYVHRFWSCDLYAWVCSYYKYTLFIMMHYQTHIICVWQGWRPKFLILLTKNHGRIITDFNFKDLISLRNSLSYSLCFLRRPLFSKQRPLSTKVWLIWIVKP